MASGSDGVKGVVDLELPTSALLLDGGAGDGDLEEPGGMETPGRGAPLTIWSSLELDMVVEDAGT